MRVTGGVAAGAGVTFVLAMTAWMISSDGQQLVGGIPGPALAIGVAGVVAWLTRLGGQLPHLRERRAAVRLGVTAFAIGSTPLTGQSLIVAADGLCFLRGRAKPLGFVPARQVEIAALTTTAAGVGISLSIDGRWFDVPIVLEVGGPAGSAWSVPGLRPGPRLVDTIAMRIQRHAAVYVHRP
ncbi:hypothetical protein [Microbacterium sulfonylureivorans]|uniref:hypothetical protein n=1 Tax=Microbacterium sulfonylureivorans TaxID=2486854 RepID=UPI000FD895F1|nr:hypothetical protein [Microbacterium sulfonylureivorans]